MLGREGEAFAAEFLEAKGYTILERNFRNGRAEVDIVARKDRFIVFVEVKSRSNLHFGYPEVGITKKKVELIAQAASYYMFTNQLDLFIRFDVVALHKTASGWDCIHTEDAFFPYE